MDPILIGRVTRPQGNRGEVVVLPETDFAEERFSVGASVQVNRAGGLETLTVRESREYQGKWIVGFTGIDSIDAAETLRGCDLTIPADALKVLGPGSFFVHDLVGMTVQTVDGVAVGQVNHVQFGSGSPLLVIDGARGEVLVPFNDRICRLPDLATRTIVIDPPEGLVELNQTRDR
jgi:16S rRNA processing protein RimM